MGFNCTGCGLCCTNMDKVLNTVHPWAWMNDAVAQFPYKALANGHCEMLHEGKCMVYENRPLLCDIERMADTMDLGMSKQTWFDMNYQGCKTLQQRAA